MVPSQTQLFPSLFMFGITLFGAMLTYRLKRPVVFKLKLGIVYLIPAYLSLTYLLDSHYITNEYRILMVGTFILLSNILYWREMKSMTTDIGYHRHRLTSFLDMIPDMLWMKDVNNRLIYANKAVEDHLLLHSCEEIYGKTSPEIAKMVRSKGISYTIGSCCDASDNLVLRTERPAKFNESGLVDGKFLALQVYKAPIYETDFEGKKKLVGIMGIGRDLTYDYIDHEIVDNLCKEGKVKEAIAAFKTHKEKYTSEGPYGDN